MPLNIQSVAGGVVISVKVVPNSSRDQIVGLLGDALKVKVAQPPEGGRANRAVERLLAKACAMAPSDVQVISGETQSHKRVMLAGATAETIAKNLM